MELTARIEQMDERLRRVEARLGLDWNRFGAGAGAVAPARSPVVAPPSPDAPPAVPTPVDPVSAVLPAASTLATATTPPPDSAASPAAARARRQAPTRATQAVAKTSIDYERFVGVAVLGRVGIAAVLLAAGYFGQLGWREIGPVGRVAVIYGLAALFIGTGFALRRRVSPVFLGLLWGGGTAAMYLAGVLAKLRFELVDSVPALAMLVAACAVGQFLARTARMQVLAVTALAGAFAAPVLVGSPVDARTVLCVYLLAVHAWSAFTESKFGWGGARLVGVLGTGFVALLWLGRHGAMDVSTYVHLQAYLLGVTAPEWGSALLSRDVRKGHASAFFGLTLAFEALVFLAAGAAELVGGSALAQGSILLSDVLPAVAALWTSIAVAARARTAAPTPISTALARLSAALLLPSVWLVFRHRGLEMNDVRTLALASLAVLSVTLLAVRRRFGLGHAWPLSAAILGIFTLGAIGHPDPRILIALVPAAAMVWAARDDVPRGLGYLAGVAAIAVGFARSSDAGWLAGGFGAFAGWSFATLAVRRVRPSVVLGAFVDVTVGVAIVAWARLALAQGPFVVLPTPFANAGTLAALAIAGIAVARRPWRVGPRGEAPTAWLAGSSLVAIAGLAVWRELHAALSSHAAVDAQVAIETMFFAGAALAALFLRARTGARAFAALAVGLLALGFAWTSGSFDVRGHGGWIAGEIAALALGASALAAFTPAGRKPERVGAWLLLVAIGGLWVLAVDSGRLTGSPLVANPRLAAGAVVALAFAWIRFQAGKGLARPGIVIAGWLAGIAAYVAGRLEVGDAIANLASTSWKDAIVSLYTAVFASAVLALGFARRAADLRWLALLGFGVLVFKVSLHDLANVSTPLRILISGGFGVILLLAAYSYARRKRVEPVAAEPVEAAPSELPDDDVRA